MPNDTLTTTRIFLANAAAYRDGYRRALNEGGTASSKTFSILQLLIVLAQAAKAPTLISVVSESLPHLKRGCIRDFFSILAEPQDNNPNYSKTEFTYTFGKGVIEFFGADNPDKVRGPRRQILFLNEANNIPWETARGLDIRTEVFTFADWNPTGEFWAHENWIGRQENACIHSTYQDAIDLLPRSVVENIESNRERDPNWWNVYGLGLLGRVEGLVYPAFEQCETLPTNLSTFYGLDFGFTGDPAALVANVIIGGKLYSQELVYEHGLTNDDIARKMMLKGIRGAIFADAAEPKSIEELRRKGFDVRPSEKGPGSVEYGHQRVRQYFQHWTKDSLNCIKEQRNFRYMKDGAGRLTDRTTHEFSHGMDARRYAVASYRFGGIAEGAGDEELTQQYASV